MIMKLWINVLHIMESMIIVTRCLGRVGSTRIKVAILLGLFCVLETTGLESIQKSSSNSSSSSSSPSSLEPVEGYDPVESYYQLRRHYLTSTSRGDGSSSSSSAAITSKKGKKSSYDQYDPRREKVQHQTSQTYHHQNHHHLNTNNNYNSPHHTQIYHQLNQENKKNPSSNKDAAATIIANHHRCYVCLPPNKNSREAGDILSMFGPQEQARIPDCANFGQHNSHEYEFPCPKDYGGCILRIHGANISRACSKYRLNDCKRANGVDFCYCTQPLCNDIKQEPIRLWQRGQRENGIESDDEDEGDSSSGDGNGGRDDEDALAAAEPPSDSGVVHQYTTTTLVDSSSAPLANFNSEDDTEITDISNFSISNQGSNLSHLSLSILLLLLFTTPLLPFHFFS